MNFQTLNEIRFQKLSHYVASAKVSAEKEFRKHLAKCSYNIGNIINKL